MDKEKVRVSMTWVYSKIGEFPIQSNNLGQRMKDRKEFLLNMLSELGIEVRK